MIRIRQLKVPLLEEEITGLKKQIEKKWRIPSAKIKKLVILRKSLDARDKRQFYYVYEVDIEVENEKNILKRNQSPFLFATPVEEYHFPVPRSTTFSPKTRPIIVGSGPAGLFAAYLLAENHYFPIIIERGDPIEIRVKKVDDFWQDGKLDEESNVQFGEGGAGTFSDGKLNTLAKDKFFRGKKVFEILVACGAPKEIMYEQKPHIGTDLLRTVMINMRKAIIKMGGEFRYRTCLTDIIVKDGSLRGIEINHQDILSCQHLILAIGHSARDTFSMLYRHQIDMEAKSFAVGLRVQHRQQKINQLQYGDWAKYLPSASYKLTYTTSKNRGVYTFCMCPGGYVVNASSEQGHLVVNGMSNHDRDSENANSAVVVTVDPNDFGSGVLAGVEFQRRLEEKAYQLGQGKIPIQLWSDFLNNRETEKLGTVTPVMKGQYHFANLNELFNSDICEALKEGILGFDHKMKGFAQEDMILAGVESRTSSPVRIKRDLNSGCSSVKGLYPCGEGSGYAGGITTAAMDGIYSAEKLASSLARLEN